MNRTLLTRIAFCFLIYILFYSTVVYAASNDVSQNNNINIATVDNRPISIDRLVHTAFQDIGYNAIHITAAALQSGYTLANNGERDGVISSTPNMEEIYPNLIKVPVILEYNDCNVYTKFDSDLKINSWEDLSELRVGMLTQRIYIANQTPDSAKKITADTVKTLFDKLIEGECDAVVLSIRAHEYLKIPDEIIFNSKIDVMSEYLYMNKKHIELIPEVTQALESVFADGRGEKILADTPITDMYSRKTVLHLISSNTGVTREDQFNKAMEEYFQDDTSIEWYSLALNSKRFLGDFERLSYYAHILRRDFVSRNISAIVVSGEDAVNFLKEYYFLFFRNVPVLFYSVGNNYEAVIHGFEEYFTGITESLSAYETVSEALKLFPNTTNLFVINDYMTEGKNYRTFIENQLIPLSANINITYNENVSRDLLLEQIKDLPQNSIVLIGSYFCDASEQYYPLNEMKKVLDANCSVPIFSMYSTDLVYNSIGGKCLDYVKYSDTIIDMLNRLSTGAEIKSIPVITDTEKYNKWVFDKTLLTEFGIKENVLPANSIVLNKKISIWVAYPGLAGGLAVFTLASIVIIIALFLFSRKLQKKNSDLLEMKKHLHTAEELLEKDNRIKEIKERLEWVVHTAPVGYMLVIGGNVVEINEIMKNSVGLAEGDIFKQAYNGMENLSGVVDLLKRNATVNNQVMKVNYTSGEVHRCLVNVASFKYNNKPATVVWMTDIEESESYKDEIITSRQALSEVKDRLERIINTAPISFVMYVENKIVEINERLAKYSGLNIGDDIIGMYTYPEQFFDFNKRFSKSKFMINEACSFNMIDGKSHRCLMSATTVEYNRREAIVSWAVDIEESERQKDRLKIAQQSLQQVIDALPIPIRILDIESSNIIYVNNSFLELFGFNNSDEICNRNITSILPEYQKNGELSSKESYKIIDSKETISTEIIYQTVDGTLINSLLVACRIDYNGRSASLGIIRDLSQEHLETELRAAALAAAEASRAKTNFLANMSHEIRTPMNGIIGFTELALDAESIIFKNEYLMKIRESSDVLLTIINDILDISKIEADKMQLECIPFEMHDVFMACRTIIEPQASEKGIKLYCYTEPSVGKKLLGDPFRIRQVLLNLLSNAVKFTNNGIVKLFANIENQTEDSVTMRFEVKDSGIGMSQEHLVKVFEPFTQADVSTTRQYGGTGLGLPITKNLIEIMGGTLMAESTLGVGSKFNFVLTFKTISSSESIPADEIVLNNIKKPIFKAEILVCEDNAMNRNVICDQLAMVKIDTVVVENGKECVDCVKQRMENGDIPFDLIFMDIHMPVMDGLEAASELRRIGNKSPVVALTANIMNDEEEIYKKHGIPDCLAKPFTTQMLWTCLFKYLTPLNTDTIITDEHADAKADTKRRKRLMTDFVRDNQSTFKDINNAVTAGDIKLAHRLSHTLKGLAGLLGKPALQEAAHSMEFSLKDGKAAFTPDQMSALEYELNSVLNELSLHLEKQESQETQPRHFDKEKAVQLFDRLELLLQADSVESLNLVDELRMVPETDILINQIEDYEYEAALETLSYVKRILY